MRIFLSLAVLLGFSLPLQANDLDIPEAEWRQMAQGRTLTYWIDGVFFALERYSASGNGVMLQAATGECLSGTWAVEDGAYCFYWEADPKVCFRHVRQGEEVLILHLENGVETGEVQVMSGASDAPLVCDGLTS